MQTLLASSRWGLCLSESLNLRALTISEKTLGADHPRGLLEQSEIKGLELYAYSKYRPYLDDSA